MRLPTRLPAAGQGAGLAPGDVTGAPDLYVVPRAPEVEPSERAMRRLQLLSVLGVGRRGFCGSPAAGESPVVEQWRQACLPCGVVVGWEAEVHLPHFTASLSSCLRQEKRRLACKGGCALLGLRDHRGCRLLSLSGLLLFLARWWSRRLAGAAIALARRRMTRRRRRCIRWSGTLSAPQVRVASPPWFSVPLPAAQCARGPRSAEQLPAIVAPRTDRGGG